MFQIGVTVVPVIGILYDKKAFNPVPNAAEVDAIFDAPLEMFLKVILDQNYFLQKQTNPVLLTKRFMFTNSG